MCVHTYVFHVLHLLSSDHGIGKHVPLRKMISSLRAPVWTKQFRWWCTPWATANTSLFVVCWMSAMLVSMDRIDFQVLWLQQLCTSFVGSFYPHCIGSLVRWCRIVSFRSWITYPGAFQCRDTLLETQSSEWWYAFRPQTILYYMTLWLPRPLVPDLIPSFVQKITLPINGKLHPTKELGKRSLRGCTHRATA